MDADKLRAAAVQLNATEDLDANLSTADRLTREAAARGAQLVVLPEKWTVLGRADAMAAGAQALDGPALTWARQVARELGIDLIAGSLVERVEGQAKTANTSVHIGPDGELHATYRKLHMFDVEVEGTVYSESAREQAGESVTLTHIAHGHALGMTICYDLRFPELYRELSARGATIIAVPSAFTLATTREHWEVLLRARAIENQAFVIAANQIGEHPPGNRSGGRSLIVDPWGLTLALAADTESVITADLDFAKLADIRRRLPALAHRRPEELYRRGRGSDRT
ncbi:MAG: carbon-nitrogen hydrolase family protein [Solirubrobacteraceae bacterium]